jgi:hypothetical protein
MLPISGKVLSTITAGKVDAEAHDAAYPERIKATIYLGRSGVRFSRAIRTTLLTSSLSGFDPYAT